MTKGKIILIPTPLGDINPLTVLAHPAVDVINSLNYFAVENLKTARRFLKKLNRERNIDTTEFIVLNKKSTDQTRLEIIQNLLAGKTIGILSEAGLPVVADPGSDLVLMAHQNRIPVTALAHDSSITTALACSGLQGQSFTFHGYLSRDDKERKKQLQRIESFIGQNRQTQIFIETPYRNDKIFEAVKAACRPDTHLCAAGNLNCPGETIITAQVREWGNININKYKKKPTVFLLG